MKAIMMSIKPEWVAKILNGEKTLEIRKTIPQEYLDYCIDSDKKVPIDVYIYCTKDKKYGYMHNGKSIRPQSIVAKFTLNSVEPIKYHFGYYDMSEWTESYILENACLTDIELDNYLKASQEYNEKKPSRVYGYAWHIDNLVVFDKPKELGEFWNNGKKVKGHKGTYQYSKLTRAPQSWCYVEIGE